MVTPFVAIRLFTATVLLGSVVLAGSAMAKPAGGEVALASAAAPAASVPASVAVTASVPASEPASACTRKVKVVYAGYGEAARAGCPTSAN
jgi:hypothetical protein